ncbi:hypothetical protein KKF34_08840 [Myxococcota bacterium]|nr:hypothetical protein [Myxococcota bacterium]MBU1380624.1 hypothetical protein [Myxococcota bacterium]MBU1496967.1 hypothetical protein [Myxococcota bacterium]
MSSIQMSLPLEGSSKPRRITKRPRASIARRSVNHAALSSFPSLPLQKQFLQEEISLLERRISAHMNGDLSITVTDNRSSIISVKRIGGRYEVRLHHMFLNAPFRIIMALGRYIEKADAASGIILETYIDSNSSLIKETNTVYNPPEMETVGNCFNLQEIYDRINKKYFNNTISAVIGWGRQLAGKPRHHRSVKMGTYSLEDKIIRIHRALDRDFIPLYFIESVVFHEMLHQLHGVDESTGKRLFHPPRFLEDEKKFEHYHLSRRWEQENINRLLYF